MTTALAAVLAGDSPPGVFAWVGDPGRDLLGEAERAGWGVRRLDSHGVHSRDALYDRLAVDWQLPAWFGRNLDALWDVLGELAATPLLVQWDGLADLATVEPDLAQQLLDLFVDASGQAPALAVVLREDAELAEDQLGLSALDGLL